MSPPIFRSPSLTPCFLSAPATPVTMKVFPEPLAVDVTSKIVGFFVFLVVLLCGVRLVEMPISFLILLSSFEFVALIFWSCCGFMSSVFVMPWMISGFWSSRACMVVPTTLPFLLVMPEIRFWGLLR